jgi:hypothetical protein
MRPIRPEDITLPDTRSIDITASMREAESGGADSADRSRRGRTFDDSCRAIRVHGSREWTGLLLSTELTYGHRGMGVFSGRRTSAGPGSTLVP